MQCYNLRSTSKFIIFVITIFPPCKIRCYEFVFKMQPVSTRCSSQWPVPACSNVHVQPSQCSYSETLCVRGLIFSCTHWNVNIVLSGKNHDIPLIKELQFTINNRAVRINQKYRKHGIYTPRLGSWYARPWKPVHFNFSFWRVEFTFTCPVDEWSRKCCVIILLWSENHQVLASNQENLHWVTILLALKALKENRLAERHAKATLFLFLDFPSCQRSIVQNLFLVQGSHRIGKVGNW